MVNRGGSIALPLASHQYEREPNDRADKQTDRNIARTVEGGKRNIEQCRKDR